MSALPTTLGVTDASTASSLSPPAPMAIDGATPERVSGGHYPVPSTHRGDFYTPTPTHRPVPSSAPRGAAPAPGDFVAPTTSMPISLAPTTADLASYDPFLAHSAMYNMGQHSASSHSTGFIDYTLPPERPSSHSGALVSYPGSRYGPHVSPTKEQLRAQAQALREQNTGLQDQVLRTQQEALHQRCQDMQDFQQVAENYKQDFNRKAQTLSIQAKDAVDVQWLLQKPKHKLKSLQLRVLYSEFKLVQTTDSSKLIVKFKHSRILHDNTLTISHTSMQNE